MCVISWSPSFNPWLIAVLVLVVNQWISKYLRNAERKTRHIEKYITLVQSIEDDGLNYWTSTESKISQLQLNLKLRRLSTLSQKIQSLDKRRPVPKVTFLELKQAITLSTEDERPISDDSERAQKIMWASSALQSYYLDD